VGDDDTVFIGPPFPGRRQIDAEKTCMNSLATIETSTEWVGLPMDVIVVLESFQYFALSDDRG